MKKIIEKPKELNELSLIIDDIGDIKNNATKSIDKLKKISKVNNHLIGLLDSLATKKEKLESYNKLHKSIFSHMGIGMIVIDRKRKIELVSKSIEKLIGIKEKDLIGKDPCELFKIIDNNGKIVPEKDRPLNLVLKGHSISINFTHKLFADFGTGKLVPLSIEATPIKKNGKIIGATMLYRDVTQEREIDEAKTEFISIASHQLKTPLTSISWHIEAILDNNKKAVHPIQQVQYLNEIYKTSKRMTKLVDNLLNVSRLESGSIKINRKHLNLAEIIKKTIKEQLPMAEPKNISIVKNLDIKLKAYLADPIVVEATMQNLLSNAIKYSLPGGNIVAALKSYKNDILLSVSDDGIGIPKNQQSKVFTKFFRADNARKLAEGTGLGLYIINNALTQAGCSLKFTSAKDKGSTFTVIFPNQGMKPKKGLKTLS